MEILGSRGQDKTTKHRINKNRSRRRIEENYTQNWYYENLNTSKSLKEENAHRLSNYLFSLYYENSTTENAPEEENAMLSNYYIQTKGLIKKLQIKITLLQRKTTQKIKHDNT